MNKENTEKLLKDFPNLYRQYYLPMDQTCMCWGIETSDGWFELIYDLSKKLSKVSPECEASQVKEKFARLRFYVDNCNEEGHKLIDEAERKSGTICEECGKPGKVREDLGWVRTLCDEHYDEKTDPVKILKKRMANKK